MDRHNQPAGERERLPAETLSPLATRVDELLALYRYELTPAIDAINAAVAGYGGLFDPETSADEIRTAIDELVVSGPPPSQQGAATSDVSQVVLYVDGSAHSNGPAGAGAVIQADETPIARLGRPVALGRTTTSPNTPPSISDCGHWRHGVTQRRSRYASIR